MSELVFLLSLSFSTHIFTLVKLHLHSNLVLLIVAGLIIKLGSMFSHSTLPF